MNIESLWYEASPYLYAVFGVMALISDSRLAVISGLLLISASVTILRLRWLNRRRNSAKAKRGPKYQRVTPEARSKARRL